MLRSILGDAPRGHHSPPGSCVDTAPAFLKVPSNGPVADAVRNATRYADSAAGRKTRRRVFDLIPLGFELDMLWLHVRTLEREVDRFLVTEATTTHTFDERKPTLLSDAIANGTVPVKVPLKKLRVRVVDFPTERPRFCPRLVTHRCYEALQRFLLLDMLLKEEDAAPHDLVIVNDVDEFLRPSSVAWLRQCYPFNEHKGLPEFVATKLTLFKFGVHCDHGNTFLLGSRAFSAGTLRTNYGGYLTSPDRLEALSTAFTATRSRGGNNPQLHRAGWHLTTFGDAPYLARKAGTFLHSNMFRDRAKLAKGSLDVPRLDRCMRYCLELDRPLGTFPACKSRDDPNSRHLPGTRLTSMKGADLPPLLVKERNDNVWPEAWFSFLDTRD